MGGAKYWASTSAIETAARQDVRRRASPGVTSDLVEMVRHDDLAGLERLLTGSPRLSVLVTSRARLLVPFEWVFPVPGLSMEARDGGPGDAVPPGWEAHPVGLEELVLAYLREPGAAALPGPARTKNAEPTEVTR